MRRRYDVGYKDKESFDPWESYSDLYCGLLLVFVLLFFFAIYQYIDAREKNNADTIELQKAMQEEQTSVLALYKADLEDQETAYQEKSEQLEKQKELVDEQQVKLNQQQVKLEQQQGLLEEQQTKLEEQQEILDSQANQIEQIIGIRGQLIDELNRELMANQIQIQADLETGAIIFESTILFDRDSNELIEEGKEFFRKFIPVYLETLLKPKFRDYIAEIMIEGHTDDTGSYLHNLELSQQRAWSVAEFILSDESDFINSDMIPILKSLVTVNGCADRSPVYQENGMIDANKSRRVEIKFRLKDQEMIRKMDEILNKEE